RAVLLLAIFSRHVASSYSLCTGGAWFNRRSSSCAAMPWCMLSRCRGRASSAHPNSAAATTAPTSLIISREEYLSAKSRRLGHSGSAARGKRTRSMDRALVAGGLPARRARLEDLDRRSRSAQFALGQHVLDHEPLVRAGSSQASLPPVAPTPASTKRETT